MATIDRIRRGRENANRTWTCPLCGEEVKAVKRALHLEGHA